MALIDAKCPNCGGSLRIDNEKKAAICPYCKEAYIVQDAINNFTYVTNTTTDNSTHNTTHIGSVSANVVQLNDDRAAAARQEAAEAFMSLKEYKKAETAFQEVCDLTPQDYRGWWGRIRAITHEFDPNYVLSTGEEASISRYRDAAFKMASIEAASQMKGILNEYHGNIARVMSAIQEQQKREQEREEIRLQQKREKELTQIESGNIFYKYSSLHSIYDVDVDIQIPYIFNTYHRKLKSIIIPKGVKTIEGYAFCNRHYKKPGESPSFLFNRVSWNEDYFSELTEISLPDGLEKIGPYAFANCKQVKRINIPDSVKRVCVGAFFGCTNLEKIYIPADCIWERPDPNDDSDWSDDILKGCDNLHSVEFGPGTKKITGTVFWWNRNIKEVHIPDSVEIVDQHYGFSSRNLCPFYSVPVVIASPAWKKKHKLDFRCLDSGCYVATAVYGSYDCPEVWTLRRYRDFCLARTWFGRMFIQLYYATSPTVVRLFGQTIWFNRFFRRKLDMFVAKLKTRGYKDTPYADRF